MQLQDLFNFGYEDNEDNDFIADWPIWINKLIVIYHISILIRLTLPIIPSKNSTPPSWQCPFPINFDFPNSAASITKHHNYSTNALNYLQKSIFLWRLKFKSKIQSENWLDSKCLYDLCSCLHTLKISWHPRSEYSKRSTASSQRCF